MGNDWFGLFGLSIITAVLYESPLSPFSITNVIVVGESTGRHRLNLQVQWLSVVNKMAVLVRQTTDLFWYNSLLDYFSMTDN